MASTENLYVGDGSTVLYSFTFPYINPTDVKVSFNGTDTTEYSLANATTVELVSAPPTGTDIRIYRDTDTSDPVATFFPGSAIRAQDLNDNFVQTVYAIQEVEAYVDGSDAILVKDTADQALANSTVALAAASDAQASADAADAKADNAIVIANTKVDRTSTTGSAVIPSGSTAERDGLPQEGYLRYNTLTDQFEGYTNVGWSSVGGGDVEEAPIDGNQYARKDAGWSVVTGGGGGGDVITQEYNGASAWGAVAADGTLEGGLNVTVTKTGTGIYAVTFLTPLPNANYSVNATTIYAGEATVGITHTLNHTETGFQIDTLSYNGTSSDYGVNFSVYSQNALPPKGGTGTDAWASVGTSNTAGPLTVSASFNVNGITRDANGMRTVVFGTPMPNANYSVVGTADANGTTNQWVQVHEKRTTGFDYYLIVPTSAGGVVGEAASNFQVNATNATLPLSFSSEQIESAINNPGLSAWGYVDEGGNLLSGLNVGSSSKVGDGIFEITFATPMPDANYAISGNTAELGDPAVVTQTQFSQKTANGFRVHTTADTGATAPTTNKPFSFIVASTNALPHKGGTGTDAWGAIGGDGTITASFNTSTVTRTAAGSYTVTFTTPMPSANYAVNTTTELFGSAVVPGSLTTTGFSYIVYIANGTLTDGFASFTVNATNATLPDSFSEEQIQSVVDLAKSGAANPGLSAWGYVDEFSNILGGNNIASVVVDSGNAVVRNVTFQTPMPDANYSVVGNVLNNVAAINFGVFSKTSTGFSFYCNDIITGNSAPTAYVMFQVVSTNALPPKGGTGADAWATVDQNGALQAGFNIASCTYSGPGTYDYVFTTPMPTANYAVLVASDDVSLAGEIRSYGKTTTGFTVFGVNSAATSVSAMSHSVVVHATNATLPSSFTEAEIQSVIDFIPNANPSGVAIATGRVDATYTYLGGFGCTINRNGIAAGGVYNVVFDTPQPNANYIVQATASQEGSQGLFCTATYRTVTTTGFQIVLTSGVSTLANVDSSFVVYSS